VKFGDFGGDQNFCDNEIKILALGTRMLADFSKLVWPFAKHRQTSLTQKKLYRGKHTLGCSNNMPSNIVEIDLLVNVGIN
jgi:hypothetical protein